MATLSRIELPNGTSYDLKDKNAIPLSQKGAANGVATLDANKKVPVGQIPVDGEINTTSVNPVQNKVIANYINSRLGNLYLTDQSYAYTKKISIEIAAASSVIKGRDTEANIFALTGSRYGELWYATDTQKYYRKKNTTTTASSANWRDDTTVVVANMALPNQQTDEPYLYIKLNTNNKYYSKLCKFFTEASYDNINGSTYITAYCRQTNQYKIESCSYNGNKLVGIYQPSADTNIYYFKFATYKGTYGANTQYSAEINIYTNFANNTPTLEFINKNHADYATVNGYSYIECPAYGIHTTGIWQGLTPLTNNTYDIGTSTLKWRNGHFSGTLNSTAIESDIPTTATIASGDRIIINDESASKLRSSSITFGTNTNQYLANNGTWQTIPTPATVNDGTLTIKKGTTTLGTFSANQSSDSTITIPEEEIPQELFWCTYGTTTYTEITQALSAGKFPTCTYNGITYEYLGVVSSKHYLCANSDSRVYRISVDTSNVWSYNNDDFELINRKVALGPTNTTEQYPNAKSVYDAVQDVSEVTSDLQTTVAGHTSTLNSLHEVAFSGDYNDLNNVPTLPTVNNATISLKLNGTVKGDFTTNQESAETIDLGTVLTSDADFVHKSGAENITGEKSFNGGINVRGIYRFGSGANNCYEERHLGTLNAGTYYADLDPIYKDGTWHRMWRIIMPNTTGNQNFWGRVRITLFGTYSSFNASGVMSKTITCNYNGSSIYNNVGFYDSLGLNVEKDFRISEAIWNSTTGNWEFLVWQKNLNGNNSPQIMMEMWHQANTSYQNILPNVRLSTVELTQATTYSATKASPTGGTKTVTWADEPKFEAPLGYEIYTKGNLTKADITALGIPGTDTNTHRPI